MNTDSSAGKLRRALGEIGDRAVPAPSFDHLTVTAVATDGSSRPAHRGRVVAAALAGSMALIVVAVWALVARTDDVDPAPVTSDPVTTESVASAPSVASTIPQAWPDLLGNEVPAPPVPAGWKVLDYEDFRFAVPADWTAPIDRSCATTSPGLVLVQTGGRPSATCSPAVPLPASVLTIEPAQDVVPSGIGPVAVGTLSASVVPAPDCPDCSPTYLFDNGLQVTVTGPDRARVLATFTDSGARRVLQTGVDASRDGWQTVTYDGVSALVPEQWDVVDLPASYTVTTDAAGNPVGGSGYTDPGQCGDALFADQPPRVSTGTSGFFASCPATTEFDLAPYDGLWVRTIDAAEAVTVGEPIAQWQWNGLRIVAVDVDRVNAPNQTGVLDLIVTGGERNVWITLGVGPDPSIARSVLKSLSAGGG